MDNGSYNNSPQKFIQKNQVTILIKIDTNSRQERLKRKNIKEKFD